MKPISYNTFFTFFICCLSYNICLPQEIKFSSPLDGIPGKDYFIDCYVDHDATSDSQDVFCGSKTYNGHHGTDFLLRSFQTMDSGVFVHAVAEGQVIEATDGAYDRNKKWITEGLGNHVTIELKNGFRIFYGHLKKNSVPVQTGDKVKADQIIGKVGSSGKSCFPHLHLEVHDKEGKVLDPFLGNCSKSNLSLWITQPPYDTLQYSINNGFVPYVPQFDSLLEGYSVKDTFNVNQDSIICLWVLMHGLRKGDSIHVEWYTPFNELWSQFSYTWELNWWYDYAWPYIKMPKQKGTWNVKFYVNKKLRVSRNFYVQKVKRK